jgi:ribosomal protein L10
MENAIHVVSTDTGKWAVTDGTRSKATFPRKEDAVAHARTLARRLQGVLVIHNRDGRVSDVAVYRHRIRSAPVKTRKLKRDEIRRAIATVASRENG